ncbi:MAG: asparaginase [Flammeovirgaceae bacterium]|nr:asparaginase [Flammeovirgaceae bacterium]
MNHKVISLKTVSSDKANARVMIIYTGGTFGMVRDSSGVLIPLDFSQIVEHLPTLRNLFLDLTVVSFDQPIDSSDIDPNHWIEISRIIKEHYNDQDGFVILHGTDTMAYTASALSFMLLNLQKPVILTGAQLPISDPRSDARENLITSLEIAASKRDGRSAVPEVCVYFDYELFRGNRTRKVESMSFDAFKSENYPALAKAGVKIEFNHPYIHQSKENMDLILRSKFDRSVLILKLFPGLSESSIVAMISIPGLRAIV